MKKQLVFIHGGEMFETYEHYRRYLESKVISEGDLEYREKVRWHYVPQLQKVLNKQGDDEWQVIRPDMPSDQNAKYEEWVIWFRKYVPHMRDGVVLMGHSLGAMFLARYLSENELPVLTEKLVLVAPDFADHPNELGDTGKFYVQNDKGFEKLNALTDELYLVVSKDDFVVPYENSMRFVDVLPNVSVIEFKDRGHFLQESFEEMVEMIK